MTKPSIPLAKPMPLRSLRISTRLKLHPEFVSAPTVFARRHSVDLADDVFPEVSYKKDPDRKKVTMIKANIHLVQHGAIRLFAEKDAAGDSWVQSVELNPSLLLCRIKDQHLTEDDLAESLTILKAKITPLLADPLDACHIIPGIAVSKQVAYWNYIESEIFLPGIHLPSLHRLRHSLARSAEGSTRKRIQLGDKRDNCVIRFKAAVCTTGGQHGSQSVEGVRVKLCLKGAALIPCSGQHHTRKLIDETMQLVSFQAPYVAEVHQEMMSRLEGIYLPVPPEWTDLGGGKPITHAKTIALISLLTSIPLEDLRTMDNLIRDPSLSSRKRLDIDVPIEAARLKPVAVSTLFGPEVYATQPTPFIPHTDNLADPQIKAMYGPSTTSL